MGTLRAVRGGRRAARAGAATTLIASLLASACTPWAGPSTASHASIQAYRGLGTWIDIYDGAAWADPAAAVEAMKARGVRTLYLETSNADRPKAFVHPDGVRAFVDAAHEAGLSIVGWYLAGLDNLRRDYRRSMAAIRYRTPSGNGFDSFALDIESRKVASPARRSLRLVALSLWLRMSVGGGYPLGAITPSPPVIRASATYWPGFPYRTLAHVYDVFLPMTYFTWQVHGRSAAHRYAAQSIDLIRQGTGDPATPIHVIGGIAGDATSGETRGFVDAVGGDGAIGASYYTFPLTPPSDWPILQRVTPNLLSG